MFYQKYMVYDKSIMASTVSIILGYSSRWFQHINNSHMNNSQINFFIGRNPLTELERAKITNRFVNSENQFVCADADLGSIISLLLRRESIEYLQVLNLLKENTERMNFSELTEKDWIDSFRINNLVLIQILSELKRNKILDKLSIGGSIVNISSFLGIYGSKNLMAYAASKAALVSISKSLAREFNNFSIRSNVVTVGNMEFVQSQINSKHIHTKLINIEDALEVVRFLLGRNSVAINGQEITLEAFETISNI